MTRVLVTGAAGFVGRHIMRALACTNTNLIPVVRTEKENLVAALPNVEDVITTTDLFTEDEKWLVKQCAGIDVIVHAAWYAEPGKYLKSPQNMSCLIGSLNIAKAAIKAGVGRLIGIGTCFEYDLAHGILSVDTPLKPLTPYAATKAALYLSLSQLMPEQSVEFAWCRLFYLYGEGEDERRLIPYLHRQLQQGKFAELGSGTRIRDYLDVAEAGKKIANIALGNQVGPINICSGVPVSVKQIAEQIADEYGRRNLLRFGVRQDNLFDPPVVVGIVQQEK